MSLLSWFSYVLKLFATSVKQLVDKSVTESEQRMKAVIAEQVKTQVAQYVQAAYAEGYAVGYSARVAEEGLFIDGQATNYKIPEATIAEVREMVQDKETYPDGPVIVKYTTEDE